MPQIRKELGPYSVGEIPQPLQIAFVDYAGAAINLAGFAVDFVIERIDGATPTNVGGGSATIEGGGTGGITQYAWAEEDCALAGRYRGQMWVGNGTLRLASIEYWWDVIDITAAPAI